MTKYRTPDGTPGPDYQCARCDVNVEAYSDAGWHVHVRLYRLPHHAGDLLCVLHAAQDTRGRIDPDWPDYIGDYLPARPTPEGDNFYGNGAGDVEWWYALPKFRDPERELVHLREERLRFLRERDAEISSAHATRVKLLQLRSDLQAARQTRSVEHAERWRAALVKIRDVQLDDVGTNTPNYTTETTLKMRLVAEEALR